MGTIKSALPDQAGGPSDTAGSHLPRPSPRDVGSAGPNALGYADHTAFAAFGAELVYGQLADGTLAHISAVERGLGCSCTCPACGRTLVARKGRKTMAHFSHHGNASGCGNNAETNAHIWAKDVLNREHRILLPSVRATVGKETLQTYKERMFEFRHAELEKVLGDIVPDVILTTKDGRQMLVEVMVTHACGPEKVAKLRDRGLATLEVDLSRWRKSNDRLDIERALVDGAPREWLFNRKADEAEASLSNKIAERAAEAARRAIAEQVREDEQRRRQEAQAQRRREAAATQIARAVASAQPSDAGRDEHDALGNRGLLNLLQPRQACMGFTVANERWQAAIVERMVEAPIDEFELPEFDVAAAMRAIDDCLVPDMPKDLASDVRDMLPPALGKLDLPEPAVRSFLLHLCDHAVLRSDDMEMFTLPDDRVAEIKKAYSAWQIRDRRSRSVDTAIDAIVDAIPVEEHGEFSLASWRTTPIQGFGLTLEELIASEKSTWDPFETAISSIRGMVEGGTWVAETMGLPLQGELLRAERRASLSREREASEREATITRSAAASLGPDGSVWVNAPGPSGATPVQQARVSVAALTEALRSLDRYEIALAASMAADKRAADCRQQLRVEAEKGLGATIAPMFLNNHDAVLGASPWTVCRDEAGLRRCRLELAKWVSRERKRHRR